MPLKKRVFVVTGKFCLFPDGSGTFDTCSRSTICQHQILGPWNAGKRRRVAMAGSYRSICVVICGGMLLCGFGAYAYGADRCVTDQLHNKTAAYAMPNDVTLELQLQKEKDVISIPNPKEVFDFGEV